MMPASCWTRWGRGTIDISPRDLDIVCRILRKHVHDCEAWAFGSRAQRTSKTWSDLDLGVITDTPLPLEVPFVLMTTTGGGVGEGGSKARRAEEASGSRSSRRWRAFRSPIVRGSTRG